jgi:hypothetical protein
MLLTDWRATAIQSVLKIVYFLRTKNRARFGVYFSIVIHNLAQNKVQYQNIPKTFNYYYSRTITNLLQISDIVWSNLESPTRLILKPEAMHKQTETQTLSTSPAKRTFAGNHQLVCKFKFEFFTYHLQYSKS